MTRVVDDIQAGQLLHLARAAIRERLLGEHAQPDSPSDPCFAEPAATFVTLKIGGQLRGCIGSLEPADPLWESVRQNALNAAFRDTRFMPLTENELDSVHIDISILTDAGTLEYTDADDLVRKLRPGVDGVILRYGRSGATFLPQVWEQLPTPSLFLGQLCRKAGLTESCWKEGHPEIQIYQVQCIAEERG